MKKILISNIGNRNIKYTGTLVSTNEHNHLHTKSFREDSEVIWNAYETEKKFIKEQILVNHIERLKDELYGIILFVTNQENSFNFQDTIFEGKILQCLFKEKYGLNTSIYEYNSNPTDEEQIVKYVAKVLKEVITEYSHSLVIYNEAGGTPQMKSVIKDLLRYYLPENKFLVTYSDQQDQVYDKKRLYGQKYTLLKSARDFTNKYEYAAAAKIIGDADNLVGVDKALLLYVTMAAARKNFERELVKKQLQNADTPKHLRKNVLLQHYAQSKLPENIEIFSEVFSKTSQSNIFEIASICQLYFHLEIYTLGVATYYRLCEELLQCWAKETYREFDLTRKRDRDKLVNENNSDLKNTYPNMRNEYGLPFLIALSIRDGDKSIIPLFQRLSQTNSFFSNSSKGIDLLRNKCYLAHKNQSVTPKMINQSNPLFLSNILPEIFDLLNLPDVNIYEQMNRDIQDLFLKE
ncbi:hypothetical protein WJR50_31720 [Catalinimonas sp. 4WD22]|uniref:hypothetical protein n=1 Tax=Catalinimonas locisalis TaxID=3133978 RepID=UPI003101024E